MCVLIWRVVILCVHILLFTHPCHIPPLAQARPMLLCIYTSTEQKPKNKNGGGLGTRLPNCNVSLHSCAVNCQWHHTHKRIVRVCVVNLQPSLLGALCYVVHIIAIKCMRLISGCVCLWIITEDTPSHAPTYVLLPVHWSTFNLRYLAHFVM